MSRAQCVRSLCTPQGPFVVFDRPPRRRDFFPKDKFTYIKGTALSIPCDTSRDFPTIHSFTSHQRAKCLVAFAFSTDPVQKSAVHNDTTTKLRPARAGCSSHHPSHRRHSRSREHSSRHCWGLGRQQIPVTAGPSHSKSSPSLTPIKPSPNISTEHRLGHQQVLFSRSRQKGNRWPPHHSPCRKVRRRPVPSYNRMGG